MSQQQQVRLHVYDLSQGMARQLSPAILGKQIDGIWHTGVVVFNKEYYFGGGICADDVGVTPYGTPVSVVDLGVTSKSLPEFMAFLKSIQSRFTVYTYDLLANNCNNFSSECVRFLIPGSDIPQHILDLPREALSSPLGALLRPAIDAMQQQLAQMGGHQALPQTPITPTPQAAATTKSRLSEASMRPVVLSKDDVLVIQKKLSEYAPGAKTETVADLIHLLGTIGTDKAFPALDLLRIKCCKNEQDCLQVACNHLLSIVRKYVLAQEVPRPSKMMAVRVACNCFAFDSSIKAMVENKELLEALGEVVALGLQQDQHNSVHVATSVLACNLGISSLKTSGTIGEDLAVRIVFAAGEWIQQLDANIASITSTEVLDTLYYLLVTMGTIMQVDVTARDLFGTLELGGKLENMSTANGATQERLIEMAKELLQLSRN